MTEVKEKIKKFSDSNKRLSFHDLRKTAAVLLIPFSLVIIAILVALNIPTVFEPIFLLPVMNSVFQGLIPLLIVYISIRVYLKSGSPNILMTGAGFLIFGLGAIVAGWLSPFPDGPNMSVTVHNTCSCIGSLFFLAGAGISRDVANKRRGIESKKDIVALYSVILIFVTLFTLETIKGIIPPFFIQGIGPTITRQLILENTIVFLVLSSIILALRYLKTKSDFFFWYSVSLALISIGLISVFFPSSVGSLVSWVGRITQYIGCIFALFAIFFIAQRSAIEKGLKLEGVLANFFVDIQENYKQLVEAANDAIVTFDEDYLVLLWNNAAWRIFGYTEKEAIGSCFLELAIDERDKTNFKNIISSISLKETSEVLDKLLEINCRRRNGTIFPVELNISRRYLKDTPISTCIIRDITARKQIDNALIETTEYLENLINYANAPIITWDPFFRITRFNRAFEELTGKKKDEIIGKTLDLLFPDESRSYSMNLIQRTFEGERFETVEIPILDIDGDIKTVLWNSANILDSGGCRLDIKKA